MESLDPLVKFSSLVFIVFTLALALAILLPKFRNSLAYKYGIVMVKPFLPFLGWLVLVIGSVWIFWGVFQDGSMKLIGGLGVVWAVLGTYILRVGYSGAESDGGNATDLKVISLCITFSFSFLFLLLYGGWIFSALR